MAVFRVNRASFIEVKNRLFGTDVKHSAQLAVYGKLLDSVTYSLITVFRTVEHYTQHVSAGALEQFREKSGSHETTLPQLKQKLEALRQSVLRTSGVVIARKNKLTHHSTRGDLGSHALKMEIKSISQGLLDDLNELVSYIGDLVLLSSCAERECFVDLYKSDVVLLRCKVGSSVHQLSHYLNQVVRFPGRPLDLKFLDQRSTDIFEHSKMLRSMLRSHSLLIQSYQEGNIPMTEFLIQRNEVSMKYIDLSQPSEFVFDDPLVFLSDSQFIYNISTDALKITETLTMHVSHTLNMVQTSMDLFFKLSNFLESELCPLTTSLRMFSISSQPNALTLARLFLQLDEVLNTNAILTAETIKYKEFRIDEILLRQNVTKAHHVRVCVELLVKLLEKRSSEPVTNETERGYRHRYNTMSGAMGLCTLGLGLCVGRYADKL